MTTITAPEGFADWPKPAQKFAMRVLTETLSEVEEGSLKDHGDGYLTFVLHIEDELRVRFTKRPGEGWRFWYGDDGWGKTLRSMREILYRLGSSVELERSAR